MSRIRGGAHDLLDFGGTLDTQHALENKAFTVQADRFPVGLGGSRDTVGKASCQALDLFVVLQNFRRDETPLLVQIPYYYHIFWYWR